MPRLPSGTGAGVALAFGTALISGVSIWVNAMGVKQVPDAAVYTTGKNLVAGVILVLVLLAAGSARTMTALDRRSAAGLGIIAVVGGSIPFVLFFSGLALASAPSAAFIHKTLFVWVALLAVPLLGERLGWIQLAALAVLLGGQALIAPPSGVRWGTGETLIAAATALWSVEVVIARRLLVRGHGVDAAVLGAARMALGAVLLVGYLAVSGRLPALLALGPVQWAWVGLTGLFLAGYVGTWFAALRRAPATVVTSVLVGGAVITAALSAIQTGTAPSPTVLGGNVLILAAIVAIGALARRQGAGERPAAAVPADAARHD